MGEATPGISLSVWGLPVQEDWKKAGKGAVEMILGLKSPWRDTKASGLDFYGQEEANDQADGSLQLPVGQLEWWRNQAVLE